MTLLTIETQVKLSILVNNLFSTARRIDNLRAEIAKQEADYRKLCKGYAKGNEPAEPMELVQNRTNLIMEVDAYNGLEASINKLEEAALDKTSAKVISRGKKGVMVVLTSKDEITGKKTSVTRHLRLVKGTTYSGKSLFGHRTTTYELQSFVSEKAA